MEHNNVYCTVKDVEGSVEQLLDRHTKSNTLKQQLLQTSIVFLPVDGIYFSDRAESLFHYFEKRLPATESVEACTDNESIPTQIRWSNEIILGCFLVLSEPSFQIFLNVLSSYLYDKIRGEASKKVTLSVILSEKTGKLKQIDYSGPESGLEQISDILKNA